MPLRKLKMNLLNSPQTQYLQTSKLSLRIDFWTQLMEMSLKVKIEMLWIIWNRMESHLNKHRQERLPCTYHKFLLNRYTRMILPANYYSILTMKEKILCFNWVIFRQLLKVKRKIRQEFQELSKKRKTSSFFRCNTLNQIT